jgi:hypothetical protein
MNLLFQIAIDESAREYSSAQYPSVEIFKKLDINMFMSVAPRLDELARQIGAGVEGHARF